MEALDSEKLQGVEAGGDIDGGTEAAAILADFDVSRGLPVGDRFAVEKNRPRDMRLVAAEADGLLFFDVPERLPREDGDAVGRFRRRLPSGRSPLSGAPREASVIPASYVSLAGQFGFGNQIRIPLQASAAPGIFVQKMLLVYNDFPAAHASAKPALFASAAGRDDRIDPHKHGQPAKHLPCKIDPRFIAAAVTVDIGSSKQHVSRNSMYSAAVASHVPVSHIVYYRRR